jgi:hypothetical protein
MWCLQVGDRVTAGDIYGVVKENTLMDHKVRTNQQQQMLRGSPAAATLCTNCHYSPLVQLCPISVIGYDSRS